MLKSECVLSKVKYDSPALAVLPAVDLTTTDATFTGTDGNQHVARFLWIAVAGNVAVEFVDGTQATFAVAANDTLWPYSANGGSFPAYINKVFKTGTTCTGIRPVL